METISLYAYPDVPKQPALPLEGSEPEFNAHQHKLLQALKSFKLDAISGPHIKLPYTLIAISAGELFDTAQCLVNPTLVSQSGKQTVEEECLFFPGMQVCVERPTQIEISYQNAKSEEKRLTLEGRWAALISYQLDVLKGTLVIDTLSALKKKRFLDRYKKQLKLGPDCGPQCTHEHH